MFTEIKVKIKDQFKKMAQNGNRILCVDYNRDDIWEAYLNAFDPSLKQEHNCNCCKAFIRQIGGAVVINDDLTISTVWDVEDAPAEFAAPIRALHEYVLSRPIKGLFSYGDPTLGTDKTHSEKHGVVFNHFYVSIPASVRNSTETKSSRFRDCKNSLKRAINEISEEAIKSVLDLIAQGSLYRGVEYKKMVTDLRVSKRGYKSTPEPQKDIFLWKTTQSTPQASSCIRGSAIGTLLLNLSEGKELEYAVKSFETIVAPANYKRPTALVTPRMIEDAKDNLNQLGLISALNRRILNYRDINPSNSVFVHRAKPSVTDVFSDLKDETITKVSELKRVEEVTLDRFINDILPTASDVKILFEGRHLGNLATLTGANEEAPKNLFKWDNSFGWSYTGGVADSIKEKVKRAGGSTSGWLRISLEWYNHDDLDLHFKGGGDHVCFSSKIGGHTSGTLDVDMNAGHGSTRAPVENIIFPRQLPAGEYEIGINNYTKRESSDVGFAVQTECNGNILNFSSQTSPRQNATKKIEFTVDQAREVVFKPNDLSTSGSGVTKWGMTTGTWRKVNSIIKSPNHWDKPKGNKHWFFILDSCVTDEETRPFYNEFLCEALSKNRKVMEVLGLRCKVTESEGPELSGLGFSETIRNEFFATIGGTFNRTIKVKI